MGPLTARRVISLLAFVAFLNLFLFHWVGSVGFALLVIGFFLFVLGLFLEPVQWNKQQRVVFVTSGLLLALLTLLVFRDSGSVEIALGRTYGTFFLIWVSLMTITLFLRHVRRRGYVGTEVFLSADLLVSLGLFNAESFIARRYPPTVNHRVDHVYLSRMSSDGVDGWKLAYEYALEVLTKRGYEQKPLLDREDRREVAYSAIILSYLSDHYNDLVYHYGSNDNVQEYQQQASVFLHEMTLAQYDRITVHLQSLRVVGEDDQMRQERLLQYKDDATRATARFLDQERISSVDRSVRTRPILVTHDYYPSFDITPPCALSGDDMLCRNFFRSYSVDDRTSSDTDDVNFLDIFFAWNGSQERAYRLMKRDIPVADLIRLYRQYIVLHERIASQPQEERDYDIDISFSTPFLEW